MDWHGLAWIGMDLHKFISRHHLNNENNYFGKEIKK